MTEIIEQSKVYVLPIKPMPTPRTRSRIVTPKGKKPFVSIYNPSEYTSYKNEISIMVHNLMIPKSNWNTIDAVFYIPIPKSYSNKLKMAMHGTLHEQKPDWDNFIKGLQDGIQMNTDIKEKLNLKSPIDDDSGISTGTVRKIWINDPIGKIVFRLCRTELSPLAIMMS